MAYRRRYSRRSLRVRSRSRRRGRAGVNRIGWRL